MGYTAGDSPSVPRPASLSEKGERILEGTIAQSADIALVHFHKSNQKSPEHKRLVRMVINNQYFRLVLDNPPIS